MLAMFGVLFVLLGWLLGLSLWAALRGLFMGLVPALPPLLVAGLVLMAVRWALRRLDRACSQRGDSGYWRSMYAGEMILLLMAGLLLGFLVRPPSGSEKMEKAHRAEREACQEWLDRNFAVAKIEESHSPGESFILVQASVAARSPIRLVSGGWVNIEGTAYAFLAHIKDISLDTGPSRLSFRLVNTPYLPAPAGGRKTLPKDGPYRFGPVEVWYTRSGADKSCKAVLLRGLATRAYKAADFSVETLPDEFPDLK